MQYIADAQDDISAFSISVVWLPAARATSTSSAASPSASRCNACYRLREMHLAFVIPQPKSSTSKEWHQQARSGPRTQARARCHGRLAQGSTKRTCHHWHTFTTRCHSAKPPSLAWLEVRGRNLAQRACFSIYTVAELRSKSRANSKASRGSGYSMRCAELGSRK